MATNLVKPRKKAVPPGEIFNRDGHWVRQFGIRSEPWPMVESWATEEGYRLVALKGQRRMYRRNFPSGTVILVDLKEKDGQLNISAWVQFSTLARALHLFGLPAAMNPLPDGWLGIIPRRMAGRALNRLLERFHQDPIAGSQTLHLADLDPSALLLAAISLVPLIFFLVGSVPLMDWNSSILPVLYGAWGRRALYLLAVFLFGAAGQHWLSSRWLRERWMKATSLGVLFFATTSCCLFSLGTFKSEVPETRLVYYCLGKGISTASCSEALRSLSPRSRDAMFIYLQALEKKLTVR